MWYTNVVILLQRTCFKLLSLYSFIFQLHVSIYSTSIHYVYIEFNLSLIFKVLVISYLSLEFFFFEIYFIVYSKHFIVFFSLFNNRIYFNCFLNFLFTFKKHTIIPFTRILNSKTYNSTKQKFIVLRCVRKVG